MAYTVSIRATALTAVPARPGLQQAGESDSLWRRQNKLSPMNTPQVATRATTPHESRALKSTTDKEHLDCEQTRQGKFTGNLPIWMHLVMLEITVPLNQITYTRELAREWRCFGSSQSQDLFRYQGLESHCKMMSRRRTTSVGLVTLVTGLTAFWKTWMKG